MIAGIDAPRLAASTATGNAGLRRAQVVQGLLVSRAQLIEEDRLRAHRVIFYLRFFWSEHFNDEPSKLMIFYATTNAQKVENT
jgi:hypothetical protein